MTLAETFQKVQEERGALGAFNVSTLAQVKAIVAAARALEASVILEMSPGEADFLGIDLLAKIREGLAEGSPAPLFLNLDHARDVGNIEKALAAGFDMVHFDGSDLPLEENIARTKEVVALAHEKGALAEGEIDQAGGHSVLRSGAGEKVLTDPAEARRFVAETGVDVLAAFCGNLHGVYEQPLALDLDHLARVKEAAGCYLSLHGGSGVKEGDLQAAAAQGISKVNVNTELRLAWSQALRKALIDNPEEIVPYKVLAPVVDAVRQVVERKVELLGGGEARVGDSW